MNPPQVTWSKPTKERGGKPDKTPSLKNPYVAVTASLRMEVACALCNAIDTLCIKRKQHWLKSALCCLCHVNTWMKEAVRLLMKTPKNLVGKSKKHICWVMMALKTFPHLNCQCWNHPTKKKPSMIPGLLEWPQKKAAHDTRSTRVAKLILEHPSSSI